MFEPYSYYENNEQYLIEYYHISQGRCDISNIKLDVTDLPLGSSQNPGYETWEIKPGDKLPRQLEGSEYKVAIGDVELKAPNELTAVSDGWSDWYTATKAGDNVTEVSITLSADQGLVNERGSLPTSMSVGISVELEYLGRWGAGKRTKLTDHKYTYTKTVTGDGKNPVLKKLKVGNNLVSGGYRIRVKRTDVKDTRNNVKHGIVLSEISSRSGVKDVLENIRTSSYVQNRELKAPNEIKKGDKSKGWTEYINVGPSDKNITEIQIDVGAPQGLFKYVGRTSQPLSAAFEIDIEYQGRWQGDTWIANPNKNGRRNVIYDQSFVIEDKKEQPKSSTPQGGFLYVTMPTLVEKPGKDTDEGRKSLRRTFSIPVSSGVYKIAIRRKDTKILTAGAQHQLLWMGLKCKLEESVPFRSDATYLVRRTKATATSQGSRGRLNLVAHRYLPTYDKMTKKWLVERKTSCIADIASYILRQWLPEDDIDLHGLYTLAGTWETRKDEVNVVFDTSTTVWEALTDVLAVGRTVPIRLWDKVTFVRDEAKMIPQSMFTLSDIEVGSVNISHALPTVESSDGVKIRFMNKDKGYVDDVVEWAEAGSPKKRLMEIKMTLITSKSQALREAKYRAREQLYRRKTITFVTPTPGQTLLYGTVHKIQYPLLNTCICQGRVVDYDGSMKQLTLSDALTFEAGKQYAITLKRRDRTLETVKITTDIGVEHQITLEKGLTFSPVTEISGEGNATTYVVKELTAEEKIMTVTGVAPVGQGKVKITGIFDDPRVHAD